MPVLSALSPLKLSRVPQRFFLGLFGVTVALLIGLRHEIGNDWFHYLDYYDRSSNSNLFDLSLVQFEPGYALANWLSSQINFGIYGVNLICGIIFTYGLIFFCKSQPNPWISLGIAMPFIGIVFAMGGTRQATAIGIIYIAIVYLMRGSRFKFFILLCLATTFHKSAIVMLPFGIFGGKNNSLAFQFICGVLILLSIWLLYDDKDVYRDYIAHYINRDSAINYGGGLYSYGARVRVWLNFLPVLLYLFLSKNKTLFKEKGGIFWKNIFLAIFISIPLVEYYSAAIDRINIYFSVVQIFLWPRIIFMQNSKFNKAFLTFCVFTLYFLVLYVWMNFARHRDVYVPYQNILFLGM